MKDDSGRLAWVWGPLVLVGLLVVVFQFAETGGAGTATGESRGAPSSVRPAGPSPGAAGAAPVRAGVHGPVPGYPAAPPAVGPAPYAGMPAYPPWAWYGWPQPFPRPGDHSGRYWGSGAAEWGPPIGEYGPDTQVDPYWWVAAEETDR